MKSCCKYVNFLLIILFLGSCQFINPGEGASDLDSDKPKIKSCKIYSYKIDMENNLEEGILMEEFEYDMHGRETKLIRYDSTGNIACTFTYKYDQAGNLSEKIWKEAGKNKDSERSTTLTYDLGGPLHSEKDTMTSDKYDKKGNLLERIWNDPRRNSEIKETHHYFEDGKEREVVYFNEKNEFERKNVFIYDSLGNEIALVSYNRDNEIEDKITYVYDEYGNIKEDIYWNVKDSIPEQIIKYVYEFY